MSVHKLSKRFINKSISHATLREEDIADNIKRWLIDNSFEIDRGVFVKLEDLCKQIIDLVKIAGDTKSVSNASILLNEDVFDLMNEIAPEGSYFSAHEGDGSDFGFWEVVEDDFKETPSPKNTTLEGVMLEISGD